MDKDIKYYILFGDCVLKGKIMIRLRKFNNFICTKSLNASKRFIGYAHIKRLENKKCLKN